MTMTEAPPERRARLRLTRRGRLILKVSLSILLALGLVFGGTAGWVYFHVQGKFNQTHQPIQVDDPLPNGPMNVLVLGSDRRDVLDPSLRDIRQYRGGSGRRADTIMLVHIYADHKRAVLVSFPRDLRVRIPGRTGFDKINASYAGGPNLVVQTVKAYTGLPVNHYVEINFASFLKIVNAVGGVDLVVDRTYDDPQSGLKIDHPGCVHFNGDLALSFVRARKVDPTGDFGRIQRQQRFIRVLMDKITSVGFLLDLPRVVRLSDAIGSGVVTDKGLSLGIVRQVANRLAGFDQKSMDFRVLPSYPKYLGGVAYVLPREDEVKKLFAALLADEPPPAFGKTAASVPVPADVRLDLADGSGAGLAQAQASRLRKAGYQVRIAKPAKVRAKTTILFRAGEDLKAKLVAESYPDAEVVESAKPLSADVVVTLGSEAAAPPAEATPGAGLARPSPPAVRSCG